MPSYYAVRKIGEEALVPFLRCFQGPDALDDLVYVTTSAVYADSFACHLGSTEYEVIEIAGFLARVLDHAEIMRIIDHGATEGGYKEFAVQDQPALRTSEAEPGNVTAPASDSPILLPDPGETFDETSYRRFDPLHPQWNPIGQELIGCSDSAVATVTAGIPPNYQKSLRIETVNGERVYWNPKTGRQVLPFQGLTAQEARRQMQGLDVAVVYGEGGNAFVELNPQAVAEEHPA